jgi:hypothetical protein
MKNKPKLLTLILTILFSFAVTSVVWAECFISISPSSGIQGLEPGESIQFTAETTCTEGEPNPPSYTWEISETDCTDGGSIDQTGLYTAPNEGCADIIMVTDTANGNISAIVPIILNGCTPTVAINPSNAVILPGHALTFTATTYCNGSIREGEYTWEISEMGCTGGSIDPDTRTYTSGAEDGPCQDTIMVTDTANGGIAATATFIVADCLPVVDISGPATLGPPCPASGTYTVETFWCDGNPIPGTYRWELDGKPAGTGNTFEVTCTEDGVKVLTVTDTANGNITDSISIVCDCPSLMPPLSEATFEGCGIPFFYGFGLVTIQGADTIFGPFTTLSYDSPLIVKLPKLVNRKLQRITQFVILRPSILFPAWDYPAIVEVTVSGPSSPSSSAYSLLDTFIIPKCGQ